MALYSRAETDAQSLKVLNTTEKNSVDKYDHDNTLIVNGPSVVPGAQGYATAARRTIFIDAVEATLASNKSRGLTAPGWWEYMTYTDDSGKTRHKAQHLVSMGDAPANTADLDDAFAADAPNPVISIGTQPISIGDGITTLEIPAAAQTFVVAATVTGTGTVDYQWQRKTATSDRWVNIGAATDSSAYTGFATGTLTIVIGALTDLDLNNYQYRAKVTSTTGANEVTSNAATLKLVNAVP
jgi:nitroreductase